ncbi:MAG: hypothetical protein L6Q59_02590 [Ignavibacteriaceae bacterium]|nr:hypothetical protein [Ignavibacteriaceae bacterium]
MRTGLKQDVSIFGLKKRVNGKDDTGKVESVLLPLAKGRKAIKCNMIET